MISVNIATQKAREESLKKTLHHLLLCNTLPDQVNIYLNDYNCPEWLRELPVNVVEYPNGDLKAAAKFWFLQFQNKGVYITLDDDFIVKGGYVGYLADAALQYVGCIVGFHGIKVTELPLNSFYRDSQKIYCYNGVEKDQVVSSLGTGCLSFVVGSFDELEFYQLMKDNDTRTDAALFKFVNTKAIPCICLTRETNFLTEIPDENGVALWKKASEKDTEATALVNSCPNYHIRFEMKKYNPGDANIEWQHLKMIMMESIRSKVVEFGSGMSTPWINEVSKELLSIEHDERYNGELSDLRPLKDGWYNLTDADRNTIKEADVIVVDGPKGKDGTRYNFPDSVIELINEDAVIFVDDCHRKEDLELAYKLSRNTGKDIELLPGKKKLMAKIY